MINDEVLIIPCNVKDYDVIGAFNKLSEIDWKQSNNMKSAARYGFDLSFPSLFMY